MKIDYEARIIRITLKPGNISQYPGDQRGSSTELGLVGRREYNLG